MCSHTSPKHQLCWAVLTVCRQGGGQHRQRARGCGPLLPGHQGQWHGLHLRPGPACSRGEPCRCSGEPPGAPRSQLLPAGLACVGAGGRTSCSTVPACRLRSLLARTLRRRLSRCARAAAADSAACMPSPRTTQQACQGAHGRFHDRPHPGPSLWAWRPWARRPAQPVLLPHNQTGDEEPGGHPGGGGVVVGEGGEDHHPPRCEEPTACQWGAATQLVVTAQLRAGVACTLTCGTWAHCQHSQCAMVACHSARLPLSPTCEPTLCLCSACLCLLQLTWTTLPRSMLCTVRPLPPAALKMQLASHLGHA